MSHSLSQAGILISVSVSLIVIAANIIYAVKHRLYQYAEKHVFVYSLLIIFFTFAICYYATSDSLWEILENVISNYVLVPVFIFFYLFVQRTMNHYEDREKLRQDYDRLAKKYQSECLVERDKNGNQHYPVVRAGKCNICIYGKDEEAKGEIFIKDSRDRFYQLPEILSTHFFDIMKVHRNSVVYNNLNIRVSNMSPDGDDLVLDTERTYYFYSLATNRCADYRWDDNSFSIRELFEPGPVLQPLDKSQLSNHLGFNGFVISKDGMIVFVKRKGNLSIAKRTYGDSIGASLKTKYALDKNTREFTAAGLTNAILGELRDELKLVKTAVDRIRIIAAYRDAVECGKPQLLFCAWSNKKAEEITEFFRHGVLQDKDGESVEVMEEDNALVKKVLTDGKKLVWISKDALSAVKFEESGIRCGTGQNKLGFFTYGKFRRPKQNELKQKHLRNQYLSMVPSASASLIMLMEHLGLR